MDTDYSREGEEEDSEEGEDGLVGESGDEYYSVLCASLGCMWLKKWVCMSRECVHIRYYISRLIGTAFCGRLKLANIALSRWE